MGKKEIDELMEYDHHCGICPLMQCECYTNDCKLYISGDCVINVIAIALSNR